MSIDPIPIHTRVSQFTRIAGKGEQPEKAGSVNKDGTSAADSRGQISSEQTRSYRSESLTDAEMRKVAALKKADAAVRAHEMAHVIAGGRYVKSGARFQYQRGPDGRSYAVAGEVGIDMSPVPGDPQATADKMGAVQRAALAPQNPSAQDRRVAAKATRLKSEALMDIALLRVKERMSAEEGETATGDKRGFAAYMNGSNANAETSVSTIHAIG